MNLRHLPGIISRVLVVLALITSTAFAGGLDAPAAPTDANSAMFTLNDLYNRLDAGTAGAKRGAAFAEPVAGPTAGTMHTLNEIMSKAPVQDDVNGATTDQVATGKKFWGLKAGVGWGVLTGTMPLAALAADSNNVKGGFIATTTLRAIDADLATDSIKAGVNIFGVIGKTEVVDTTSGTAAAADLRLGQKAWVDGVEITGIRSSGGVLCPDPDPARWSAGKRWYNNNDGTITDTSTGLVWLASSSSTLRDFCATASTDAFWYVFTLKSGVGGLTDGSVEGDWRLPTYRELRSLKDGVDPVSGVNPQKFAGIRDDYVWTTTNAGTSVAEYNVITINLSSGAEVHKTKNSAHSSPLTALVWAVRSKFPIP